MTTSSVQRSPAARQANPVASGLVQLMLSMWWVYGHESRRHGLTAQQTQLLCAAAHREARLSEMAEVLRCDPSNVSRLLDRLATRGLAYRDRAEHDRRASVVKLTDDGQALVHRIEGQLETRLAGLVADWPSYKQDAIADALARLVETITLDMAAETAAAEMTGSRFSARHE